MPAGLDAFVYTERGVYRSGETVHVTALLRDAQGAAALGVPLTLVVERPDGVEYRRVAGRRPGRRRPRARRADRRRPRRPAPGACAPSPIRSARRSARPPSWSRTTCPTGSNSISTHRRPRHLARRRRPKSTVDGRYPLRRAGLRARSRRRGGRSAPAKERPGFAGYAFGLADEEVETDAPAARGPAADRRQGQGDASTSRSTSCRRRRGRSRRRSSCAWRKPAAARSSASSRCRSTPAGADDRRQAAVLRPLARRGRQRRLRRRAGRARRQDAGAQRACATSCSRSRPAISGTAATAAGSTSRSSDARASPTARSMSPPTSRRASSLPVQWGRYRLEVSSGDADGPVTSLAFDAGCYAEASADTPDLLEIALDKPEYRPGDTMNVAVTARTAGQRHAQRHRRPAGRHASTQDVQGRHRAACTLPVGTRLGHRRLCGGDPAPSARRAGAAHARPRHRRAVVRDRPRRRTRSRST